MRLLLVLEASQIVVKCYAPSLPTFGNATSVCRQGCSDFRFRGRGGHGSSLAGPPPSPKKGSRDRTPQTNPVTSRVSMEGGGGRQGGQVVRGRMVVVGGGGGQGIGRGGEQLLMVRVHSGQTLTLIKTESWN